MMHFELGNFDAASWNALLIESGQPNLLQTWEYGAAKATLSSWTVERGIIKQNGHRVGLAQAMIRALPLGLGGLAWINRAPICDAADGAEVIGALIDYYGRERGLYVRIAPPIEIEPNRAAANYRRTETKGWASARLDLSLPEETLLRNLRGSWRNSVRKAEKSGVVVEIGQSDVLFERFLTLHEIFVSEKNFTTSMTSAFLRRLQNLLPAPNKLTVLAATHASELLGTVLIARFGSTCEYWAGNTSGRRTGIGTGQFLLWNAIIEMKRQGCLSFDLGGMDPDITPSGIYAFKAGVNAQPYRLVNEIEPSRLNLRQKLVRAYVAGRR